jgi:hypothetical protein
MYGKPAITCLKYQVFLYGSEAIIHLNAYFEWLQSQQYESSNCRHPPLQAALPPLCMAALPSPIWKRTLVWLNNQTYFKKQRGNLYGSGTITTIPNHVCKIGLMRSHACLWPYKVRIGTCSLQPRVHALCSHAFNRA